MARDAGNTRRTARRINIGPNPRAFRDSLSPTDRDDFFRFVVRTRSSFDGEVFDIPRRSNFNFQLQNASGRNIARSTRRNNQPENINVTLDPGTYFARVFWRQGQGPYRMRLSLNPADSVGEPGTDPPGGNGSSPGGGNGSGPGGSNSPDGGGNDFSSASAFPESVLFSPSINEFVGDSDPVDCYTFTTTIAGDLKIDLTDIAPTADLNITLFDQFQQLLALQGGAGPGGNEQIIFNNAPPGKYFVKVETAGPGNNSTYRLTAVLTPEDKFGDTSDDATPITGSPPVGIPPLSNDLNNPSVYQDFVGAGDIDVFRFELTQARNFFSTRLKDFTGNITLQLFQAGNPTPLLGGGSALRGALGPGTYFLRVLAGGPNDASTYTLEAAFGERESGIIVRDVNPGALDANANFLTDVNGVLFFAGEDGTPDAPVGLWRSEGTLNTTVKVGSFTNITGIANVNGTVYIAGSTTQTGMELWKWQPGGGPLGTLSLVADIAPSPELSSSPSNLTAAGNNLFFLASPTGNPADRRLYFTDGGAPVEIANAGESIRNLVYVQATDTLYYVANQTGVGSGLLFRVNNASTNPSAPVLLEDLGSPAFSPRFVDSLKVVGGDLFFVASEAGNTENRELRRIAADGGVFTYDVNGRSTQGSIVSGNQSLAVVEWAGTRYVYFSATYSDEVFGSVSALTRVNLTTGLAQKVSTNVTGNFTARNLTVFEGKVYFTAGTFSEVEKLWVTNPASLGVTLLEPESGSISLPANLVVAGGTLYFTAETPETGKELYRLNSSGLPELALDINPEPGIGSEPTNLIAAGSLSAGLGQLFFVANDGVNGREVWTV
ncbi:pre-peptidase C-terminal domain-containing protein [Thermoleptolyngbya sp.]